MIFFVFWLGTDLKLLLQYVVSTASLENRSETCCRAGGRCLHSSCLTRVPYYNNDYSSFQIISRGFWLWAIKFFFSLYSVCHRRQILPLCHTWSFEIILPLEPTLPQLITCMANSTVISGKTLTFEIYSSKYLIQQRQTMLALGLWFYSDLFWQDCLKDIQLFFCFFVLFGDAALLVGLTNAGLDYSSDKLTNDGLFSIISSRGRRRNSTVKHLGSLLKNPEMSLDTSCPGWQQHMGKQLQLGC